MPYGVGTKVHVPLTCGEAYQNQPVFWKKNGNTPVANTTDSISASTSTSQSSCADMIQDSTIGDQQILKYRSHFLRKSWWHIFPVFF